MRVPWEFENPNCAQVGVEFFFPVSGNSDRTHTQRVIDICKSCLHSTECAEWAIHNERHGIWGGLTATQRKILRSQRGIVLPREEYIVKSK
jgi:hypothetical protein